MSASYSNEKCIPCRIDTPVLSGELLLEFQSELNENWHVVDERQLERIFKFHDFKEALEFVNKIQGLSRNDFILASQIDEIESN